MIVLDTTILAYAAGGEHALREPCARLIAAVARGAVIATTTVEVIQEFAHLHGRRRPRAVAARLARRYAEGLTPLLVVDRGILEAGLDLYERHEELGAFDAVLAAVALTHRADALVSADTAFETVEALPFVAPTTAAFEALVQ